MDFKRSRIYVLERNANVHDYYSLLYALRHNPDIVYPAALQCSFPDMVFLRNAIHRSSAESKQMPSPDAEKQPPYNAGL